MTSFFKVTGLNCISICTVPSVPNLFSAGMPDVPKKYSPGPCTSVTSSALINCPCPM